MLIGGITSLHLHQYSNIRVWDWSGGILKEMCGGKWELELCLLETLHLIALVNQFITWAYMCCFFPPSRWVVWLQPDPLTSALNQTTFTVRSNVKGHRGTRWWFSLIITLESLSLQMYYPCYLKTTEQQLAEDNLQTVGTLFGILVHD